MSPVPRSSQEVGFLPTAIVAGGAGFLGSALCERLLAHQVEVVCVDNLSTGKKSRINSLKISPHFHFLQLDVSADPLSRITRAHYVFHLIDTEDHFQGPSQQLDDLLAGTHATKHLLELARKFSAKFLLASTVNIYHAFLSSQSLNDYFGPTTQTANFYSLAEAKRIAEALTAETYQTHKLDARIVRFIDVYGPHLDLNSHSPISTFLRAVKTGTPLLVRGDGLKPLYPTYIFDAIEGLMKAMFTAGTAGRIYTLASPDSITEINFAYKLRQLVPHRQEIRFTEDELPPKIIEPEWLNTQAELHWQSKVTLEDGLGQTLQWLQHIDLPHPKTPRLSRLKPLTPTTHHPSPTSVPSARPVTPRELYGVIPTPFRFKLSLPWLKHRPPAIPPSPPPLLHPLLTPTPKKIISSLILVLLSAVSFPVVSLTLTSFLALKHLRTTGRELQAGSLSTALTSAGKAQTYFSKSQNQLSFLSHLTAPFGADTYLFRLERLLNLGQSLTQASLHLASATNSFLQSAQVILGQQTGDALSLLSLAQAETTRAYELLSLASAELQSDRPNLKSIKLAGIGRSYAELEATVPQLRRTTHTLRQILGVLPEAIGSADRKKTYLILLQNNAELRPTGGFIGSFALASFQNAKLLDFVVEDVYTADGQLKGHVEPPEALKTHLGEATWYLRDVNWDPDFPTTARQAEWFLQKELGRDVSGTIAVNLYVAQNLLEALGEVELADYGETITASNLFDRAQYYSEVDFFPGSTQKKDFLSSITQAIYLRLQNLDSHEALKLAQALNRSTLEKHLLISLKDESLQSAIADLDWDGSIASVTCPKPCYADYLSLREANVGVNKANFFVTRKVNHELKIFKEDNLTATTTVTYANSSPAEAWPGGTYKNYLRLYVPQGSRLKSVLINDQNLADNSIDTTQEHGKTVFGFLVSVPIKSQATVKVVYSLPGQFKFARNSPFTYTLLVQKQPGVGEDPLSINLIHPAYMQPVTITPQAQSSTQNIILSTNFKQDQKLSVTFTK